MEESLSVSSSNFFQWTPFPSAYHLSDDQRLPILHLLPMPNSLEVLHHRVVVYPAYQLLSHTRWAVPTLTDHLSRPCAPCSHDEPWCWCKRCDGFRWMRWISRHENNDALLLVVAAEKKKSTELHRGDMCRRGQTLRAIPTFQAIKHRASLVPGFRTSSYVI